MSAKLTGTLIVSLPLIVGAWAILWRRLRPVFWFALALIVVAMGYLMATDDIARTWLPPA